MEQTKSARAATGLPPSVKKIVGITKIAYKVIQTKYLNKKIPIFGSADVTNSCNLRCKHCYWWLNRRPHKELGPDEWRNVVRENFAKKGVMSISLTGGEPLLRPDIIEAILEEMKWRYVTVVTNGTLPLVNFGGRIFHFNRRNRRSSQHNQRHAHTPEDKTKRLGPSRRKSCH